MTHVIHSILSKAPNPKRYYCYAESNAATDLKLEYSIEAANDDDAYEEFWLAAETWYTYPDYYKPGDDWEDKLYVEIGEMNPEEALAWDRRENEHMMETIRHPELFWRDDYRCANFKSSILRIPPAHSATS